jgi:murein DD-endopeptidase MepM/ murein hydrolase activator NlpD
LKKAYLVKIVPPFGYRVFRLEFTWRHIACAAGLALAVTGGTAGYGVLTVRHAEASVGALRSLTSDQHDQLRQIDAQAAQLDGQLRALKLQNEQIRKLIGDHSQARRAPEPAAHAPASKDGPVSTARERADFAVVAARIERLQAASTQVRSDGDRLRNLALRVLNIHRLADLARARALASIPSVNPAGPGVGIRSAYGWRIDPWPEFHKGVDLDADYGDPVRAAAAGTVVEAGYDGGYGYKVDIDHGNGYHTWYCHLSRIDVKPGQYVLKAQHIALVGSTGASTGPHLHYQIMLDGQAVDPAPYLDGVPERVLASLH